MDKETYRFMYPAGIASLSSVFSQKALQWLCGTTTDDNGRDTGNFMLFGDLLGRMEFTAGEGKGFRRPLTLSAGQAQYSEEQISTQWNMGRKRIRNLLDALTDNHVDFTIQNGSFCALVGESGSGKSTLAQLIHVFVVHRIAHELFAA